MPPSAEHAPGSPPVFAFLALTSGSYEGAIIRDMRLANELHRRGHKVVVYWMVEQNRDLVDRGIRQRVLCRGIRYLFRKPSAVLDALGVSLSAWPPKMRREFMQRRPDFMDRMIVNFVHLVCDGGESDRRLVSKLLRFMKADGVTHVLPTFAMSCPFVLAARRRNQHAFEYLATFQGEEIFANYAELIGRLPQYHERLREVVAGSPWPAVAVSRDYIARLRDEMGIDAQKLVPIYPGIELPKTLTPPDFAVLKPKFPYVTRDLPIVTYVGRQDAEKGIDLLLYAARMLLDKGHKFQLVICGGTSFGQRYRDVLIHIAQHLRVPTHHRRRIPGEMRDALYRYSRFIVYPSIHREPFGMVAAEAMSHGTPVVVPDLGGITEAVTVNGKSGGLTFRAWDSADLARQMERILTDDVLYQELKGNTRELAGHFTVGRMTDEVLRHMGIMPPAEAFTGGRQGLPREAAGGASPAS